MVTNLGINPVTETEMREFAERLISTIVGHSQTAKDLEDTKRNVEGLQETIHRLQDDTHNLRLKNESLASETSAFAKMADDAEAKSSQDKLAAEHLANDLQVLNDTIVSRDSRVSELEAENARLRDECSSHRGAAESLRGEMNSFKDNRDYWKSRCENSEQGYADLAKEHGKLQKTHEAVQAQLSKLNEIINPTPKESFFSPQYSIASPSANEEPGQPEQSEPYNGPSYSYR